jgi:uncharacterized protein (TIGR00297 family)
MLIPFLHSAWASTPERLAVAAAVTVCFALLARAVRGVNRSGALGGGLACLALFVGAGPGAFATLSALFAVTWVSTRVGHRRKQELGLAERSEGRSAGQVLANLAVGAVCALGFGATGNAVWLGAFVAALAEAATDTVASEVGESRARDAFMITTGERVIAGTDGGITVSGTVAGLAGGVAISCVAAGFGVVAWPRIWVPITAGFAGMVLDSLMGATIQRRGWISNQGVNFVATLAAAGMGWVIVIAGE